MVKAMLAESGGTPDALKDRSVLSVAGRIKAAVLILTGARDARTDAAQAQKLAEQITKSGGNAKAIIYPDFGRKIPIEARNKDIDPFIDRVLGNRDANEIGHQAAQPAKD